MQRRILIGVLAVVIASALAFVAFQPMPLMNNSLPRGGTLVPTSAQVKPTVGPIIVPTMEKTSNGPEIIQSLQSDPLVTCDGKDQDSVHFELNSLNDASGNPQPVIGGTYLDERYSFQTTWNRTSQNTWNVIGTDMEMRSHQCEITVK